MKITLSRFAEMINAPVEDIRVLVQTRRLLVDGGRIDDDLTWLAESKLRALGWRTPAGKTVPASERPKRKRPTKREAVDGERYRQAG